jgi:hypothetical protein
LTQESARHLTVEAHDMAVVLDHPLLMFAIAVVAMAACARIGATLARRGAIPAEARESFSVVQTVTLTLLGLIIGFTFSMALSRYDQRKNYEEDEANAIGTEVVRADLLPADDAARIRALLVRYLDQRIAFYQVHDAGLLREVVARTGRLQAELWAAVRAPALAQSTPVAALAVSGMNDVLNSQGYTQAAWWNRIPVAAWGLMGLLAMVSNVLVGLGVSRKRGEPLLLLVLPVVVGIAFLLIADIDSPRGGLIHVVPQNLLDLAASLRAG